TTGCKPQEKPDPGSPAAFFQGWFDRASPQAPSCARARNSAVLASLAWLWCARYLRRPPADVPAGDNAARPRVHWDRRARAPPSASQVLGRRGVGIRDGWGGRGGNGVAGGAGTQHPRRGSASIFSDGRGERAVVPVHIVNELREGGHRNPVYIAG